MKNKANGFIARLIRFVYYKGEAREYLGDVNRITSTGRVIAGAGGVSVHQGIKLKRILKYDFTPNGKDCWVMLCFEDQREIGATLFKKRVAKLKKTLAGRRRFLGYGYVGRLEPKV